MKKNLLICIAFTLVLCIGNLSAQERFNPNPSKEVQQENTETSLSFASFCSSRGTDSEVYFGKSDGAVRKGTIGTPFPGTSVGSNGNFLQCFEYINGELYAIRWNNGNQFGKINMTTGAWTQIGGNLPQCDGASLCYNPANGLTYVFPFTGDDSEGGNWGTIDIATGTFTVKGNIMAASTMYVAINNQGVAFAGRMGTNEFGLVDLSDGSFTQTHTAPFTTQYIQNMSFDRETGLLYWMVVKTTGNTTYLYEIDVTTGTFTDKSATSTDHWMAFTTITTAPPPTDVTITTAVNPANAGTVTGGGIYPVGAPVTLTATATEGYQFDKWTPGDATANPLTFNATVDATYTANFISTSCNPPTNLLIAYAEDCNAAVLTWTAPEGTGLAYNIYRGTEKLNETPVTVTTFTDDTFENIGHTWFVKTVCGDAESGSIDKTLGICDLGIKEHTLSFSIVPSPAQDYIKISAVVNFNTVDVINFLGQTVLTQSVEGNSIILDISNLTNGVYFVQIASEKTTSVKKFVKQ